MKSKDTHKYLAAAASGCMIMAVYTGYKMVNGKQKKEPAKAETADVAEA